MHSSLKASPHHFSQVEIWSLTGQLQNFNYFLFQPFSLTYADVIRIIVLLHDPSSAQFKLSDRRPHI